MESWKRNLLVCWIGMFVVCIGMSQIAPVLPIYIQRLGISDIDLVQRYSGIIFGCTYVSAAITSPLWGKASDKYGRKTTLLLSGAGMAIIVFLMGFATNVYQLIGLRLFQGIFSGFGAACTTLIASETPDEQSGWVLGTFATAAIAGSLLGPTIGGFLEMTTGLQSVFTITGGLIFVSLAICFIFIKEDFTPSSEKSSSMTSSWKSLSNPFLIFSIFVTTFITQVALYSIEPIVTIYVSQLMGNAANVALIAGITFSASGLSNVLISQKLGKLSDKIGAHKVILGALIWAGIVFIPQAFVNSPWQLILLRFLLGFAVAGLTPSVNILLKKHSPKEASGIIFGFNNSAMYIGVSAGSLLGGEISSIFGMKYVFFITSLLLFINSIWIFKFTGLFSKKTNLESKKLVS